MRHICRTGLAITAITAVTCLGAEPPSRVATAPSPAMGQNATMPAPAATGKVSEAGILCPTTDEAARRFYNDATALQKEGQLPEAQESYRKAIAKDPRYCDAMDNLGLLYRRQGDVGNAIYWYKRSIEVKPDNAVAHQNLAVAYGVSGESEKALEEYLWLVRSFPDNPEGHYGLGQCYLAMGQVNKAVAPLQRAEELYRLGSSPLLPDAHYLLGIAFFRLKDYRKAKEYLELAYPLMENDPSVNYLLGLSYLEPQIEDLSKAKRHLLKAKDLGVKVPEELLKNLP